MNLKQSYDYELPPELIASHPITPRQHAKLLVYDRATDTITHSRFDKLFEFLPSNCAVLLNDTKVIKARIFGTKSSGGKVELLLNNPLANGDFRAYIKGKVSVGTKINFEQNLTCEVTQLLEEGMRAVRFAQNSLHVSIEKLYQVLDYIGHIPLPPYIKREDENQDNEDYQTVWAKVEGAVAAPTASLHFSDEMLSHLKQNYECDFLTLHVGAGTFKPVESEDIFSHKMHEEFYSIPQSSQNIINSTAPLLAVGTTVTRTVEYFVRTKEANGACDLFLNPYNKPLRVDHLLTNFHLPKSTLIMLVASFIGLSKTLEIYNEAIKNRYRFFSYGDAMLVV